MSEINIFLINSECEKAGRGGVLWNMKMSWKEKCISYC